MRRRRILHPFAIIAPPMRAMRAHTQMPYTPRPLTVDREGAALSLGSVGARFYGRIPPYDDGPEGARTASPSIPKKGRMWPGRSATSGGGCVGQSRRPRVRPDRPSRPAFERLYYRERCADQVLAMSTAASCRGRRQSRRPLARSDRNKSRCRVPIHGLAPDLAREGADTSPERHRADAVGVTHAYEGIECRPSRAPCVGILRRVGPILRRAALQALRDMAIESHRDEPFGREITARAGHER